MKSYSNTVTDNNGAAIEGATVTVLNQSGNRVTIYSDSGVTTKANPVTTDSSGNFSFYVADGTYDLEVAYGSLRKTLDNISVVDGVLLSGSGSTSAPGFSFLDDTDTGAYNPSANTYGISAGGYLQAAVVSNANAVNFVTLMGGTAGVGVTLGASGSDTDVNVILQPKGAGVVFAYSPSGNSTLTSLAGSGYAALTATSSGTNSAYLLFSNGTGERSRIFVDNSSSFGIGTGGSATPQFYVTHTASAVNYLSVTGGTTGNGASLVVGGSDTNADGLLIPKGTGSFRCHKDSGDNTFYAQTGSGSAALYARSSGTNSSYLYLGNVSSGELGRVFADNSSNITLATGGGAWQLVILHTGSNVNYFTATGSTTGNPCDIAVQGSDTNIDISLSTKGSGVLKFGTHSAIGAETVTGYITIKDSGGTTRKIAVVS